MNAPPSTIIVVGATGVFGSRLVTGLLRMTDLHIILAGRSPDRLRAELARRSPACPHPRLTTLTVDTATVTADTLRASGAHIVVDAAGPYRAGAYRLARAAIAAGLHTIDLADGRAYVAGYRTLHEAAIAAGVTAITGASSTPALSNAALDALTAGWARIDRVEIAISPGNRAPRGLAVIRSILSYAGQPVRVFTGGQWCDRPGWGLTIRRHIPDIGRRLLSLAETPDLDIVPARFGVTESAIFRAGLELPVLHLGLAAAALLVRGRLLRSLEPTARLVRTLAAAFEPFGTDRGAMVVEASGADGDGTPTRATWWLVAEAGDGPTVPSLPALAAIRALTQGGLTTPGAHVCAGLLSLAAIEAEFPPHRIASFSRFEHAGPSLYERILAGRFHDLPPPVRRMHRPGWGLRATGAATVQGPTTILARAVAAIFRFPPPGADIPLTVTITPVPAGERWVRDFGGRAFASVLSPSGAKGRIVERFGIMAFTLDLQTAAAGVLGMPVISWRVGPIPMPKRLAPVSRVAESVDERGRFAFDVELLLPFNLGRLVRYRGFLMCHAMSAAT